MGMLNQILRGVSRRQSPTGRGRGVPRAGGFGRGSATTRRGTGAAGGMGGLSGIASKLMSGRRRGL